MTDPLLFSDAGALIRAYLRGDAEAFELLLPGEHDELLLTAFGLAVALAREAAGGPDAFDAALQRYIEAHRA